MVVRRIIVTSIITCKTEDILRQARELAQLRSHPDDVVLDEFTRFVHGVEKVEHTASRIGDYFDSIDVRDVNTGDLSFAVVFQPKLESHWRPLMVAVLRSISEQTAGVTITSVSQSSSM